MTSDVGDSDAWFWMLPGMFAGMLVLNFATRWFRALACALGKMPPYEMQVMPSDRKVFWVFTVLNPFPWLVIVGIPYLIYRHFTNPLSSGWQWFLLGLPVPSVLAVAAIWNVLRKNRRRSHDPLA